jgi:Tfp pilus assembly protein PilN
MNTVNFLPQSFFRRRHRRRRILIESAMVVVVAACAATWALMGDGSLDRLRDYAAEIEAEGTAAQRQLKELAALQSEFRDLSEQLRIHHQVMLPVGFGQILSSISRLTPDSIAYSDMRFECKRPAPPPRLTEDELKQKRSPRAKIAAPKADAIHVELTGLSPDDRRIADLVGKLAEHGLFTEVKLEFSKATEQDSLIARKFRVTMSVPLDRNYRITSRPAGKEGVANAD